MLGETASTWPCFSKVLVKGVTTIASNFLMTVGCHPLRQKPTLLKTCTGVHYIP
jgi:hypothetical protein